MSEHFWSWEEGAVAPTRPSQGAIEAVGFLVRDAVDEPGVPRAPRRQRWFFWSLIPESLRPGLTGVLQRDEDPPASSPASSDPARAYRSHLKLIADNSALAEEAFANPQERRGILPLYDRLLAMAEDLERSSKAR
ncbi:hypothetical protein [Phenylobacterium zucineum]|uniref:hypothetical protein n=1 Tax=Phenylobacterium zucineum TaxID=284016 RepID=UPI00059C070A|nr:hypothetical protein [Phenylobacterium zucineum]